MSLKRSEAHPHEPAQRGRRLAAALLAPVDGSGLAVVRIAFGLVVLWEVWRYVANGWIARYYLEPEVQFTYHFFPWVRAWPDDGMYWHFGALAVAAVLLALGAWYRLAAWATFLGLGYVFLLEQSRYLNHFYLMCLLALLLAIVPADRAWSLAAWWRGRDLPVPAWAPWALRLQVGLVYFYAGVAKLNLDWLSGSPMDRWLRSRADLPLLGPLTQLPDAHLLFSYSGLLIDLLAFPLLLWRPSRPWMFVALLLFHAANDQMFTIGVFPLLAASVTTIFFEHGWPRRLAAALASRRRRRTEALRLGLAPPVLAVAAPAGAPPATAGRRPRPSPLRRPGLAERVALTVLALYFVVQVALPLRHHLYPSVVGWSEEGHRFSWRMMLRSKSADLRLVVVEPDGGASHTVLPRDYLRSWQVGQASSRPDMILQLAHHVAGDFERRGIPGVSVYAWVFVSLNGREPKMLIDPTVDLATVPRDWRAASWILPFQP